MILSPCHNKPLSRSGCCQYKCSECGMEINRRTIRELIKKDMQDRRSKSEQTIMKTNQVVRAFRSSNKITRVLKVK